MLRLCCFGASGGARGGQGGQETPKFGGGQAGQEEDQKNLFWLFLAPEGVPPHGRPGVPSKKKIVARRALRALYSTTLQWLHHCPSSKGVRHCRVLLGPGTLVKGGYGLSRPGGNLGFRV